MNQRRKKPLKNLNLEEFNEDEEDVLAVKKEQIRLYTNDTVNCAKNAVKVELNYNNLDFEISLSTPKQIRKVIEFGAPKKSRSYQNHNNKYDVRDFDDMRKSCNFDDSSIKEDEEDQDSMQDYSFEYESISRNIDI